MTRFMALTIAALVAGVAATVTALSEPSYLEEINWMVKGPIEQGFWDEEGLVCELECKCVEGKK